MSLAQTSPRAFLHAAKKQLRSSLSQPSNSRLTFVIGNESADLDSLTSSLLYAYIRSYSRRDQLWPGLYIPITNIPAADVTLRPEFTVALRNGGVEPADLITLDDLPPYEKLPHDSTRWILVDHNALQGELKSFSKRVVGCIDHHEDENAVGQNLDSGEPRIIEKSGSCTSLVTNYCRDAWNQLSGMGMSSGAAHSQRDAAGVEDEAVLRAWDAQVAKIALASVLIDTRSLEDENKVTEHDKKAVDYLEAKIALHAKSVATYDRKKFFESIDAAKSDIDGLNVKDILRKDFKRWTDGEHGSLTLGIASVVKPLQFLISKASEEAQTKDAQEADGRRDGKSTFLDIVIKFAHEHDLDIIAIMTAFTDENGHFARELMLYPIHEGQADSACETFRVDKETIERLGLEVHEEINYENESNKGTLCWPVLWRQKRVEFSRKQVAPLLRKAIVDSCG